MSALIVSLFLFSVSLPTVAAPLKTYVAEFNVAGAANKDELKTTLHGLLASRLNQEQIQLVEKPEKAEMQLNGSYAQFGKMFSIDVQVKNSASGAISKVFEQGENQDELLPVIGRLAQKVDRELARSLVAAPAPVAVMPKQASPAVVPVAAPAPVVPAVAMPVVAPPSTYKVAAPPVKEESSYVVKSDAQRQNSPGSWTSEPLTGIYTSVAVGRTLPSAERELFLAGERSIRYLRKGSDLQLIAEITLPASAKILAIDSADLDRDGTPEIYVSIIDRKSVSSRVYQPTADGLELIAENQPWLYRGIGTDLKDRSIFVQALSATGAYQNDVAELTKNSRQFGTKNSRTLPRMGSLFNFSRFHDSKGAEKWVVMDEDGYLVIYSADGGELWKSSDKFGGSETYFNYETVAQLRSKGDKYRWNFLEQRITALSDGTLIVPRNEGSFSIGNNRSYSKHSLFGLSWSGAMLREAWHTRQSPTYLADYAYDSATREVVLLEVVQKSGLFTIGKTVISINKLD
jgi:hypothetical protein